MGYSFTDHGAEGCRRSLNALLYRFVRRRLRRRLQILVHAITFEQLFGFLSFLARLLALTCRLPDQILGDLDFDLDLDFSRSNKEFAISPPKMVRLPRNEKLTYRLNSRAQIDHRVWPWPWPWPWIFKVKYRICYISARNGPLATKRKANISFEL